MPALEAWLVDLSARPRQAVRLPSPETASCFWLRCPLDPPFKRETGLSLSGATALDYKARVNPLPGVRRSAATLLAAIAAGDQTEVS